MPEKERPTRTVGPSCRASTRSADAIASGSVVSGFCTEVTLSSAACNRAITSDQQEPSANSPCTSTTLRAFGGVAFAAMPRVEISEIAAPANRAVETVRLFIMMSVPLIMRGDGLDGTAWPRGLKQVLASARRQDGLHHVQIVDLCWVHTRQGGGQKIGLLLIVALDRHAVAGLDDRFKQLGRVLRGAELPACTADRSGSRQPRGAIGFVP